MIDVEETTFDLFLRYGLFFGAVFQLVCIGAAIFGPDISESHLKVSRVFTPTIHLLSTIKKKKKLHNDRKIIVRIPDLNKAARSTLTDLPATVVEKWRKRSDAEQIRNYSKIPSFFLNSSLKNFYFY